ncbi:ubiquitin carboxyl-terminal hydrolase isozyme L3 [Thozetella sp. PMI_491]|nr:ubiquitin carboxyl-terminal hydrolase isozyme L3 [Thozetella sp. PMI_491]
MSLWDIDEDARRSRKTWIPLENNPEIFAQLLQKLGVSSKLGIYDVLSLEDSELLAFIPRPCFALLATIPHQAYEIARNASADKDLPIYKGSGPGEPVIWFRQTIGNACGTIGALHAVSNGGAKDFIQPGSDLDKLLQAAVPLEPKERAQLLYDSAELEAAHKSVSHQGQSAPPPEDEHVDNHYIAFVKGDDGHLWELEGGVNGPLDRGKLAEGEDMLGEEVLKLGILSFIEKAAAAGKESIQFSVVALALASD